MGKLVVSPSIEDNKLDKHQGVANAGKIMKVNQSGIIEADDPESGLPQVTSSDNGKFLCVVNGAWAASTIPSASGVSF